VVGVAGSLAAEFGTSFRAQADFNIEKTGDVATSRTYYRGKVRDTAELGAHLSYVRPGYILGAFGVLQEGNQMGYNNSDAGVRTVMGLEASYSGASFALFAQAGKSDYVVGADGHGEPVNATLLRGGLRYYMSPTAAITLEQTTVTASNNVGNNGNSIVISQSTVGFEKQFSRNPNWSWTASANFMSLADHSHGASPVYETMALVGAKYTFGNAGSLQDRDRGYAWYGMPTDIRANGYVNYAH